MWFARAAGLIIVFEMLLIVRKKMRGFRSLPLGSAHCWMRWHIWLGLLSAPLVFMHGGCIFSGGLLATILLWLFFAVIVSGIVGVAIQQILPKRMLELIPDETIYTQIDVASAQMAEHAEMLVAATCGVASSNQPSEKAEDEQLMVIGAERSMRNFRGQLLPVDPPQVPVPNSELLRTTFDETIQPYLLKGKRSKSRLRRTNESTQVFRDLKETLDSGAHETVDALEGWVNSRRQFDVQQRMQWWLHGWMLVHLPLSVIMFVMMIVHVVGALRLSGSSLF